MSQYETLSYKHSPLVTYLLCLTQIYTSFTVFEGSFKTPQVHHLRSSTKPSVKFADKMLRINVKT